jgi:hypothetical protein
VIGTDECPAAVLMLIHPLALSGQSLCPSTALAMAADARAAVTGHSA